MTTKFHLTEDGPKTCKAAVRSCPIGGEHFDDSTAAQTAFEESMQTKNGLFSKLKKNNDPATAHIRAADKRIREIEDDLKERDARQFKDTVYQRVLMEVSQADFEKMVNVETNTREAGIGFLQTDDDEDRVIGVSYQGDHKAEEEFGLANITKELANGTMDRDDVVYREAGGVGVLTIKGEGFSNPEETDRSIGAAYNRFKRYLHPEQRNNLARTERKYLDKTVSEIRSEFKGKISPLPTKRADLLKAVNEYENGNPSEGEITPPQGEFQTGRSLSIVSDNPAMMVTMRKAKEAHNAGSLRVGSSRNPFSRGALFYDERDLSRKSKISKIRSEEAVKHAKENISELEKKLSSNGSLYAITPNVSADLQDINDARYWLNYYPNNVPQDVKLGHRNAVYGYFNKDEIEAMSKGDYSEAARREASRS